MKLTSNISTWAKPSIADVLLARGREENPEKQAKDEVYLKCIEKAREKCAKREEKKIQKKSGKQQQLKQERQEEYWKYLEREEKARATEKELTRWEMLNRQKQARATEKELTRWEMLNRQKQHEVTKGYYVERVGTKEGPQFTSTAVDYMKRWSMPLESDSDPESDIEEHGSPRSNSEEIPNPGSDPLRPDDAMGFRDEPKVSNSRDVGTDQSRPPPRYQLRRRPTGNSRSLHEVVF
ncbi:hypothetical protein QE152_g7572 [Popillia japonica]|uniref:Uncharacterized protein n=1 Tax=Popillia japonica TaxID=7064 RepID=A0AAW1MFG2_POPJA